MKIARKTVLVAILGLGIAALLSQSCAATTYRAKAQVGALAVGTAALDIYKAEKDIYAAGIQGYGKPEHDIVAAGILKVLYAVRGYERAVAAWPESLSTEPLAVADARKAAIAALDDLTKAVPAIEGVRDPLLRAVAAVAAFLQTPVTRHELPAPLTAQIPGGAIMGILSLLQLMMKLWGEGKIDWTKIRNFLGQNGATPAQLDALDDELTAAIDDLERDLNG